MKKIKLFSIILILFFALILVACSRGNDKEKEVEEPVVEIVETTAKELLERDESLRCTSEQIDNGAFISSTYYFDNDNERLRMDSEVEVEAEDLHYNTSFIVKDNWAYMWGDLEVIPAFKIYLEDSEEEHDEGLDLEEELEFNCQSWSVDNSVFNLPVNVDFADMSDLLQQFQGMQDFEVPDVEDLDRDEIESSIEEGLESIDVDEIPSF